MAAKTGPNQGLSYGWDFRESGWKTGMDANLLKLDSIVHLSVLDFEVTAPPGAPSDGDAYIIPSGATGDWSGKADQVAVWIDDASAWSYYTPVAGWVAYVVSIPHSFIYTGASWGIPGSWDCPYVYGAGLLFEWYDDEVGFRRQKAGSTPESKDDGDIIPVG